MELQFYSLYEQIDEDHYEEIYYTIGTPKKPFEEIKQEAKEEFLVRSTDGEDTPLRRQEGSFVFEESEFLQEVNKVRTKYGKNPIIAEWEEATEEEHEEVDKETQEEIKEEDFSMDDFNQFLNPK